MAPRRLEDVMGIIPELNAYETVLSYPTISKRGFMVNDLFLLPNYVNPEKARYRAIARVALLPALTFVLMFFGLVSYFLTGSVFVYQDLSAGNVASSIIIALVVSLLWSFLLMGLMWVFVGISVSAKAVRGAVAIPSEISSDSAKSLTPYQRDLLVASSVETPELFPIQLEEICVANQIQNDQERIATLDALNQKVAKYLDDELVVPVQEGQVDSVPGAKFQPTGPASQAYGLTPFLPMMKVKEEGEEVVESGVKEGKGDAAREKDSTDTVVLAKTPQEIVEMVTTTETRDPAFEN